MERNAGEKDWHLPAVGFSRAGGEVRGSGSRGSSWWCLKWWEDVGGTTKYWGQHVFSLRFTALPGVPSIAQAQYESIRKEGKRVAQQHNDGHLFHERVDHPLRPTGISKRKPRVYTQSLKTHPQMEVEVKNKIESWHHRTGTEVNLICRGNGETILLSHLTP